jgi:LEA14-like dessication related protein
MTSLGASTTAFLICLCISSCSVYREVEVHEVVRVELSEFNSEGIDLNVYVDMENPNWYSIRLTDSNIQVWLEGREIGDVALTGPVVLPKKSRVTQPFSIHSTPGSMERLLGDLFSLLFKQSFEIEGRGYVKGKALFIARKVPVSFTHRIDRKELGF